MLIPICSCSGHANLILRTALSSIVWSNLNLIRIGVRYKNGVKNVITLNKDKSNKKPFSYCKRTSLEIPYARF